MIPPINPYPPTTPHSRPLLQRARQIGDKALNVYGVVAGSAFGLFIADVVSQDAKMVKAKRWLA
jgi:hypothetical protein